MGVEPKNLPYPASPQALGQFAPSGSGSKFASSFFWISFYTEAGLSFEGFPFKVGDGLCMSVLNPKP